MENIKPLGKKSYGSIPHLSNSKLGIGDHFIHEGQERILTEKPRDKYDRIIVTEKYDGSNVGIAKIDGKIFALTRSGYEAKTSPYKQHHVFNDWVKEREELFFRMLREGERLCGEWMYQSHGMEYEVTGEPIVFFDWFNSDGTRHNYDFFETGCFLEGLNIPRLINDSVRIFKFDCLIEQLNKKSNAIKSINNPEGMVFRCERNGEFDFMAKWVRSDFEAGKYIINKTDDELIYNKITKTEINNN